VQRMNSHMRGKDWQIEYSEKIDDWRGFGPAVLGTRRNGLNRHGVIDACRMSGPVGALWPIAAR